MVIALQIIIASYPLHYLACFVSFALGSFLLAITLCKDVIGDLTYVNDDIKIKGEKSKIDILKKLSESIDLHSDAKQLSSTVCKFTCISILKN